MKKLVRNLVDEAVGVANGVANSFANPQGQNNRYGNAPPQYPQNAYPPQPSQYGYGQPQGAPHGNPPAQYHYPAQNTPAPGAQPYYPPAGQHATYQAPPPQHQQAPNTGWNYSQPSSYGPGQPVNAHPQPQPAPTAPHTGAYPPANPAQYHAPPAHPYQPQYGVHQPPPPPQPSQYQQRHEYHHPPPPPVPEPQQSGITSPTPTAATPQPPSQPPTNPPPQYSSYAPPPAPQSTPAQRQATRNAPGPAPPSYQPQHAPPPQSHPVPGPAAPTGAPTQEPLASLSAQMNNLNVQQPDAYSNNEPPRGPAPVRASDPPNEVIACCPESRPVNYSLYWYRLPDIPNFFLCSRCYADHVQPTHLAGQFERIQQPEGSVSICDFWVPRVKEVLWPQALKTNDMSALRAHMTRRQNIAACRGRVFGTGADGGKWYGLAQPGIIDDFLACEACYEDHVAGTAFETKFAPHRNQGEQEKWVCDLGVPYVTRAINKMSKSNDWQGFVAGATRRLMLPECEGKEVPDNSVSWFVPRQKLKRMRVCEACYLDKVSLSRFEHEFQPCAPSSGFSGLLKELIVESSCSFAIIPLGTAFESAVYQRNFGVFWNAAETILRMPSCSPNGIMNGNWWTLAGGCDALSVCEACYAGILTTTDTAQYFERARRDPNTAILCSFCPANERFMPFTTRFAEALDKSVITFYSDYVRKWAGVLPCPRLKDRRNGTWWGHIEALSCQECYLTFVADTPLAGSLLWKGQYDERPIICQMWSPRMRRMWLETCKAGSPGSPESQTALQQFLAFGLRRMQTYNATIPQINNMEKMKLLKYKNALHQGHLSLLYQGIDGRASLTGTTDGYKYGSNSTGWYDTQYGVTGAQMMNNMHAGLADANKPDDVMKVIQLKTMWAEVE